MTNFQKRVICPVGLILLSCSSSLQAQSGYPRWQRPLPNAPVYQYIYRPPQYPGYSSLCTVYRNGWQSCTPYQYEGTGQVRQNQQAQSSEITFKDVASAISGTATILQVLASLFSL
jgi:hypothetical protein